MNEPSVHGWLLGLPELVEPGTAHTPGLNGCEIVLDAEGEPVHIIWAPTAAKAAA